MSAAGRGSKRIARDFYKTPRAAFDPLIPFIKQTLSAPHAGVWEPACGDGRLVTWMREAGIVGAFGSDIDPQADGFRTVDFFQHTEADASGAECIVTNPPFKLALKFCEVATERFLNVFMLTRLNFLASAERKPFFQKHPVDAIFVLTNRPSFAAHVKCAGCGQKWMQDLDAPRLRIHFDTPGDCQGKLTYITSDSCEYCWLFWGEKLKGIHWI